VVAPKAALPKTNPVALPQSMVERQQIGRSTASELMRCPSALFDSLSSYAAAGIVTRRAAHHRAGKTPLADRILKNWISLMDKTGPNRYMPDSLRRESENLT